MESNTYNMTRKYSNLILLKFLANTIRQYKKSRVLGRDWGGFVTKRLKIGILNLLLLHCGSTSSLGLIQLSPSYYTCMAIAIVLITTTTIIISFCYCLKASASLAGKDETHTALWKRSLWCFNQLNISLLCTIHQLQRGLNEQTLGNFKMRQ